MLLLLLLLLMMVAVDEPFRCLIRQGRATRDRSHLSIHDRSIDRSNGIDDGLNTFQRCH